MKKHYIAWYGYVGWLVAIAWLLSILAGVGHEALVRTLCPGIAVTSIVWLSVAVAWTPSGRHHDCKSSCWCKTYGDGW